MASNMSLIQGASGKHHKWSIPNSAILYLTRGSHSSSKESRKRKMTSLSFPLTPLKKIHIMFPTQLATLSAEIHYLGNPWWHIVCSSVTILLRGHQLAQHSISSNKYFHGVLNLEIILCTAFTPSLLHQVEGVCRHATIKNWGGGGILSIRK